MKSAAARPIGGPLLRFLAVPVMAVALLGAGFIVPTDRLPERAAEVVDEKIGVEAAAAAEKECLQASTWFGCLKWRYRYSPTETEVILGAASAGGGLTVSGVRAAAYAAGIYGVGVYRVGRCLYVDYGTLFLPLGAGLYSC